VFIAGWCIAGRLISGCRIGGGSSVGAHRWLPLDTVCRDGVVMRAAAATIIPLIGRAARGAGLFGA